MARFGLSVEDLQTVVQYAIGGDPVTQILDGEKTFGLTVRLNDSARSSPDVINRLLVDTPDGQRIPLSMVAKVEATDGPSSSTANPASATSPSSSACASAISAARWPRPVPRSSAPWRCRPATPSSGMGSSTR